MPVQVRRHQGQLDYKKASSKTADGFEPEYLGNPGGNVGDDPSGEMLEVSRLQDGHIGSEAVTDDRQSGHGIDAMEICRTAKGMK